MHDRVLRTEMEASYFYLRNNLPAEGSLPKNYDLVLDKHNEGGQMQWFYYYAYHETRCLFWLENYDAKSVLSEVYWVGSPAHVSASPVLSSIFCPFLLILSQSID